MNADLAVDDIDDIMLALRFPATVALESLERFKDHRTALAKIRELEGEGKGRWQILNQCRLWLEKTA